MKSSGMSLSSGTRTRSARFGGFTLALVLLSTTCACTDGADHNVTARAGEAAVLPCTCPPNQPPYLVWQKVVGDLVVDHYRGDDDRDDQAEEYRNRTELKLTENCSLTILRVNTTDQGLYTCYYRKGPLRRDSIYLEVTAVSVDPQDPGESRSVQTTVVTSSVCVLLVIVIITVAAAVYVGIVRKKRRSMNGFAGGTLVRSV
ncbi:hypothetical protein R3I93_006547 [Phoxinus phoxinus]|uniref:Ig-like domain-containing protein n=1 Tax=Phoxinus phoxinus TaxID=58324 RepID=A0AAN9DAN0_9TELE